MLGGHQLQVGQTQRIGQRVEVVFFGQPRREVVGFVLPRFAQGNAFEFAERFFYSDGFSCGTAVNIANAFGYGIRSSKKLTPSSRSVPNVGSA